MVFLCGLVRYVAAQPGMESQWSLVWADEFSTMTSLSQVQAHWSIDNDFVHGGEPAVFKSANVSLIPGIGLNIAMKKQEASCVTCIPQDFHYTSGQITRWCDGTLGYGYLEAYIKLSRTYGSWPALWMWTETALCDGVPVLPCQGCENGGVLPAGFDCNAPSIGTCDYEEIDVFEMTPGLREGNPGAYNYGRISTCNDATTHWYTTVQREPNATGFNYWMNDYSQWHRYGLEWSPDRITYYLDGVAMRTVPNQGITQPKNLFIGQDLLPWVRSGTLPDYDPNDANYAAWFDIPPEAQPYGFTCINDQPANMQIGYVRYYRSVGGVGTSPEVIRLQQNIPDPTEGITRIDYEIPENMTGRCEMHLLDMNGRVIRNERIDTGGNTLTLRTTGLAAGIYVYAIVVDGVTMASRKLSQQ